MAGGAQACDGGREINMFDKIKKYLTILTTLALILPSGLLNLMDFSIAHAQTPGDPNQILINEIQSSPDGSEFVELYNANELGTDPIDISNWSLEAFDHDPTKKNLVPEITLLAAHSYYVFASISWLNSTEDAIVLKNQLSEDVGDPEIMGNPFTFGANPYTNIIKAAANGKSIGRISDGGSCFYTGLIPTPGSANQVIDELNPDNNINDQLPIIINSSKIDQTANNEDGYINSNSQIDVAFELTLETESSSDNTNIWAGVTDNSGNFAGFPSSTTAIDNQIEQYLSGLDASSLVDGNIVPWTVSTNNVSGISTEYLEGTSGEKDTTPPAKPTAANVKLGASNAVDIINLSNKTAVSVDVTLPSALNSIDTVNVDLSDSADPGHSVDKSVTNQTTNQVTITGIDTSTLIDGVISISAEVIDQAGNSSGWFDGIDANKDITKPTSTLFLASFYNATTWNNILGTAADTGSGLANVKTKIQRNSDSKFWDGDSWETVFTWLDTTLIGANWNLLFPSLNLTDGEIYTVYSQATDLVGNEQSDLTSKTFTYDVTNPIGMILINNNDVATTSATVTLNLTRSSDAVLMMVSNNADLSADGLNSDSGKWIDYSATVTNWKLSTVNSTKNVYVRFKDSAGNLSSIYSDAILLDSTGPTGTVSINNNANYTNSVNVTLKLSASDLSSVKSMAFSTNGVDFSAWEDFAVSKSFTLPTGDGTKTVYVKFKDDLGNIGLIHSDSIILDTTKPADPTVTGSPEGQTITKGDSITLSGSAEPSSQITIRVYSEAVYTEYINADASGNWSHTISNAIIEKLTTGEHTITVAVTDSAGNVSQEKQIAKFTLQDKPAETVETQLIDLDKSVSEAETTIEEPAIGETEVTTVGPENGETKGEETTNKTTRTLVTLAIVIIALGAVAGGYYGYQWWMEKENTKKKKSSKKQDKVKNDKLGRW